MPERFADADATAEIENPACGDVLRLTLKDSMQAESRQAQFKAKGCVAAIACGSALTELLAGKSMVEARKLRREDVIAAVGGLPQASTHAAQLAMDALCAGAEPHSGVDQVSWSLPTLRAALPACSPARL